MDIKNLIFQIKAVSASAIMFLGTTAHAVDWPTYRCDNRRSGLSDDVIGLPLTQAWVHKSAHPPSPAWPPPARQDFWHKIREIKPTMDFDGAYQPVVAGKNLYYGSSSDDSVYCIDTETGKQLWTFITEGPVRLAPAVANGKVYAGSDDGNLYCLDAVTGQLAWKHTAGPRDKRLPGNERVISLWPVRSGIAIADNTVYFSAGLFPSRGVYLCAVNASDGKTAWKQEINVAAQGYIVVSATSLFLTTGRTQPAVFSRSDGKRLGDCSGGGSFTSLADNILINSSEERSSGIYLNNANTFSELDNIPGTRLIADKKVAYLIDKQNISALAYPEHIDLSMRINSLIKEREKTEKNLEELTKKKNPDTNAAEQKNKLEKELRDNKTQIAGLNKQREKCWQWKSQVDGSCELVKAGNIIFAGGDNRITALSASEGKILWTGAVIGKALGVAVADNSLFVSTDTGNIHCFNSTMKEVKTASDDTPKAQLYPKDKLTELYEALATSALASVKEKKGYCLVLGSGDGRLAYELARRSEFKVIGVEPDAAKAAASRELFSKAGLYGKRIVIHQCSMDKLPYPDYFSNLIVSDEALRDGKLPPLPDEVFRVLRPCGGTVVIGLGCDGDIKSLKKWGKSSLPEWKTSTGPLKNPIGTMQRGKLEGSGEWTHLYSNAGNTACSDDTLVKNPVDLQWFGRPGPRDMIDRHHRNMVPLYKNGRLFVPGDCIVYAVDAYNGTIQWERTIPDSRRLGIFLDAGGMAVNDERLFVAANDKCLSFDTQTGEASRIYSMPGTVSGQTHNWSCVAYNGRILVGSACRKGASYTETSRNADRALWSLNMKVVTSDCLFGLDITSGNTLWNYKNGVIANTTITLGDGRVYFVETTNPKAVTNELGRMPLKTMLDGGEQFLVALNMENGTIIYRNKIDMRNYQEPIFLSCADHIVLLSGSRAVENALRYSYDAFEDSTGEPLWHAEHDTYHGKVDGEHGEQNRHPTIVGDTVYAWPYAYKLKTGSRVDGWEMSRKGHGCGGVSASANSLFWRGGTPWMRELQPGNEPLQLTLATRPGCWINIIPAGGLILIPEASSGCSCAVSLQTSMALAPARTQ